MKLWIPRPLLAISILTIRIGIFEHMNTIYKRMHGGTDTTFQRGSRHIFVKKDGSINLPNNLKKYGSLVLVNRYILGLLGRSTR